LPQAKSVSGVGYHFVLLSWSDTLSDVDFLADGVNPREYDLSVYLVYEVHNQRIGFVSFCNSKP
jgi:hypothetical protein